MDLPVAVGIGIIFYIMNAITTYLYGHCVFAVCRINKRWLFPCVLFWIVGIIYIWYKGNENDQQVFHDCGEG